MNKRMSEKTGKKTIDYGPIELYIMKEQVAYNRFKINLVIKDDEAQMVRDYKPYDIRSAETSINLLLNF